MNLFYGRQSDIAYLKKRKQMVEWIVGQCQCNESQAKQCLNDIESHSGSSSGGGSGVTALRVKVEQDGGTREVFHHSAGIPGTPKTCTVFWIQYPRNIVKAVGLAKHQSSDTYMFMWLPKAGFPFLGTKIPTTGSTLNPF